MMLRMTRKQWMPAAAVSALLCCAGLAAAAGYLNLGWTGIRIGDPNDLDQGTVINLLEVAELEFTDDTSTTASVDVGSSYYVGGLAWIACTTDPGLTTAAVSNGTLTVTTAASTTGTMNVLLLGHP